MKNTIRFIKTQSQTIFVALLAGIIVFTHVSLHEYGFDDAYIHFRVARNLIDTGTPYYNPAEVVKVSTSSGWIVFLTPVVLGLRMFQVESKLPLIVGILNSIFTILGMLVYTKVLHHLAGDIKMQLLDVVFQIAYVTFILPSSIGLMETPFALLLAGLGIYLSLSSRRTGYILIGCAAYLRIELVILVLLVVLLTLVQKRDHFIETISFITIGLTPFIIFDLYFFHTILPNSILAKSIIYDIRGLEAIWVVIFESFPVNSLTSDNMMVFLASVSIFVGIFYLAGKNAIREWLLRRNAEHLLFVIWGILTLGLYIWRRALIFEWYIPLYTIPLTVAISATAAIVKPPDRSMTNIILFFLFLVSCSSLARTTYASIKDPSEFRLFESGSRVKTYREVAAILYSDYPHSTLLSSEIGGLGYEFQGRILDAAGLATPEVLKYHPLKVPEERERGNLGAIPPAFVEETLPEIIVSYDIFGMALLNSKVSELYNIIKIPAFLPEDGQYSSTGLIWGSSYLRVYIRKDLPISDRLLELGS